MHKEIAEKWVAALRSGDFLQGKGQLYRDGKYCCLGVLTRLAIDHSICSEYTLKYDRFLDCRVMQWAGMDNCDGFVKGKFSLVKLNDVDESSFNVIADFIELNWEEL